MGRPFSLSGQMTLIRFRPGYAISLHEANADWVAGPTYLMRLPLDSVDEAAAISACQDEMDEVAFANYEEDEAEEDEAESNESTHPPANYDRPALLRIVRPRGAFGVFRIDSTAVLFGPRPCRI